MTRDVGVLWRALHRRLFAGLVIVAVASVCADLAVRFRPFAPAMQAANDVFYDTFYRLRPSEDRQSGPVVIVAVSDASLEQVDRRDHYGWPWPREFWGCVAQYLARCGARVIAFDLTFDQTSVYQHFQGDDDTFASLIHDTHVPVVFGSPAFQTGWGKLAPPVQSPLRGAVNVLDNTMVRSYPPMVNHKPSLALAAVQAAGLPVHLRTDRPFLLHYYGPHRNPDGTSTFPYVDAAPVLETAIAAAASTQPAAISQTARSTFDGKIVLIGTTTAGTYDLKSSPLSPLYPGVEVHATAIENLLDSQQASPMSALWRNGMAFITAAIVAAGVLIPRRAWLKMLAPLLVSAGVCALGIALFRRPMILWLPPAGPLLAIALASVGAFGWTYLLEDRQRRFMLAALSKVVSPAVAEQLARDPQRLSIGTVRTHITLLFTDLTNFTAMSETIEVERLSTLLNQYLSVMSDQILDHQGTLDKYIGDAIMCFWNAPLPQPDHAILACRAALAMVRREAELRADPRGTPAAQLFTRIGINTTEAAVGFVGSSHLFNYTALGNGVNLANRLEGANKIYGSRILMSESTAALVCNRFILRKLDVLRVVGTTRPIAVYELLGEAGPTDDSHCQQLRKLAGSYESAFTHYQGRRFDLAEQGLRGLIDQHGPDPASRALLERIAAMRQREPDPNWDGVYEALHK